MEGVKITELKELKKDERGTTFEFSARATKDFLLVKRKKGSISGEHYHEGKSEQKDPEILILMDGKIELYCKNIKTNEEIKTIIDKPSMIEISPFIWHEVIALTDVIFTDLNSLEEHKKDTIKQL